jgi:Raf kinase inhibitor-like YbhB/YbcL family protein
MSIKVTCPAFQEGQAIPKQYTGDGKNLSPPLAWQDLPAQTKSLALICEDPDAPRGTFTHWVLVNIPVTVHELPEGGVPAGALQGSNDFRRVGYGGPAPPAGKPHRYFFRLFALDGPVGLDSGATREKLLAAMQGHILAEGQLMGTYKR